MPQANDRKAVESGDLRKCAVEKPAIERPDPSNDAPAEPVDGFARQIGSPDEGALSAVRDQLAWRNRLNHANCGKPGT